MLHAGSFATSATDWRVLNSRVAPALRRLHEAGYRIVVFSNQGGVQGKLDGARADIFKGYFENFIASVRRGGCAFPPSVR